MNRYERRKAEKALKKRGSSSHNSESIDMNDLPAELSPLFNNEENHPLTQELMKELIQEKGLKEEDLKRLRIDWRASILLAPHR